MFRVRLLLLLFIFPFFFFFSFVRSPSRRVRRRFLLFFQMQYRSRRSEFLILEIYKSRPIVCVVRRTLRAPHNHNNNTPARFHHICRLLYTSQCTYKCILLLCVYVLVSHTVVVDRRYYAKTCVRVYVCARG